MSDQKTPLQSGRIVLVEDDEDVRRSLTLLLRAHGFSVDVYQSGMELFSNRTLPEPDCYLIDYKLPKMDGIALLQKLKTRGINIPSLLITGYFSNTLQTRAEDAGFHGIIEKPPTSSDILSKISDILEAA
ncbi:MAG: response regulator [Hyphomonas sp.]